MSVTATATAAKTDVTVGERFVVTVHVSGPPGTMVTFPPDVVTDAAELHTPALPPGASPPPPPPPGEHRYEASVFALGTARVPAVTIEYRLADGTTGTLSTQPIDVHVGTLLPRDQQSQQLADIRPPVPLSISPLFWVALALVVLALLALVARWWRRRRPAEKAQPVVPAVPPAEEANAALDALASEGLLARGELRAFYIRLTEIAKRYLERRLDAPIVEMTSQETVAFLQTHPKAGELSPLLRDLARAADEIKFAKGQGVVEEAERHLAQVRAMVPTLEQRLAPPPAAEKVA